MDFLHQAIFERRTRRSLRQSQRQLIGRGLVEVQLSLAGRAICQMLSYLGCFRLCQDIQRISRQPFGNMGFAGTHFVDLSFGNHRYT